MPCHCCVLHDRDKIKVLAWGTRLREIMVSEVGTKGKQRYLRWELSTCAMHLLYVA